MTQDNSNICIRCGERPNKAPSHLCNNCLKRMARSINGYGKKRQPTLKHDLIADDVAYAFIYWRYKCSVCEIDFHFKYGFRHRSFKKYLAVFDHVVPLCDGGSTTSNNIIPLCNSCNVSKKQRNLKRWITKKYGKKFAKRKVKEIVDFLKLASS